MQLKEMHYIYTIYQERSFSKAAKKLFVSQPALSAVVKKAEKEVGEQIFDRSTLPFSVTFAPTMTPITLNPHATSDWAYTSRACLSKSPIR